MTINEEVFLGHFPGHPVVPGVLIVEGMAQAGGILLLSAMSEAERAAKLLYFTSIERARFRRPVVPGDQIRYEIDVIRHRGDHCKLAARAMVGSLAGRRSPPFLLDGAALNAAPPNPPASWAPRPEPSRRRT